MARDNSEHHAVLEQAMAARKPAYTLPSQDAYKFLQEAQQAALANHRVVNDANGKQLFPLPDMGAEGAGFAVTAMANNPEQLAAIEKGIYAKSAAEEARDKMAAMKAQDAANKKEARVAHDQQQAGQAVNLQDAMMAMVNRAGQQVAPQQGNPQQWAALAAKLGQGQ